MNRLNQESQQIQRWEYVNGRQIEHQEREMKKSNIIPLSAEEFSRVVSDISKLCGFESKLCGFEYKEGEDGNA